MKFYIDTPRDSSEIPVSLEEENGQVFVCVGHHQAFTFKSQDGHPVIARVSHPLSPPDFAYIPTQTELDYS